MFPDHKCSSRLKNSNRLLQIFFLNSVSYISPSMLLEEYGLIAINLNMVQNFYLIIIG